MLYQYCYQYVFFIQLFHVITILLYQYCNQYVYFIQLFHVITILLSICLLSTVIPCYNNIVINMSTLYSYSMLYQYCYQYVYFLQLFHVITILLYQYVCLYSYSMLYQYCYIYSHPQTDLFRSIGTHQCG